MCGGFADACTARASTSSTDERLGSLKPRSAPRPVQSEGPALGEVDPDRPKEVADPSTDQGGLHGMHGPLATAKEGGPLQSACRIDVEIRGQCDRQWLVERACLS